jgi:hypothetical protein
VAVRRMATAINARIRGVIMLIRQIERQLVTQIEFFSAVKNHTEKDRAAAPSHVPRESDSVTRCINPFEYSNSKYLHPQRYK